MFIISLAVGNSAVRLDFKSEVEALDGVEKGENALTFPAYVYLCSFWWWWGKFQIQDSLTLLAEYLSKWIPCRNITSINL